MKKIEFTSTPSVNSNTVRNATLYVGDKEYPATVNAGTIKVSDTIELAKDTTTTFTLKVDLASNPSVSAFQYSLVSYEAEDTSADRNDLTPTSPITWIIGRTINVQSKWELTINLKNTVNNNKKDKSILAGEEAVVAEYTLKTTHENMNIVNWTITLDLAWLTATNVDRIEDIQLLYSGEVVASDADMSTLGKAVFDNVNFDIVSDETPLTVKVITKKFTSNSDVALESCMITKITFTNVYGKVSWEAIAAANLTKTANSKYFDVVPATVVVTKKDTSTNAKTELTLTVNKWDNHRSSNDTIATYVNDLAFNLYATDGDLQQVIVRKGTDTLAVAKYDTGDLSSSCKTITTNYRRCNINPSLDAWELDEWDNDITLVYQAANSDVSYTADLVAVKVVNDMVGTLTQPTLFTTPGLNNRMDVLPLVSK